MSSVIYSKNDNNKNDSGNRSPLQNRSTKPFLYIYKNRVLSLTDGHWCNLGGGSKQTSRFDFQIKNCHLFGSVKRKFSRSKE